MFAYQSDGVKVSSNQMSLCAVPVDLLTAMSTARQVSFEGSITGCRSRSRSLEAATKQWKLGTTHRIGISALAT